jgi:hypothetical protein
MIKERTLYDACVKLTKEDSELYAAQEKLYAAHTEIARLNSALEQAIRAIALIRYGRSPLSKRTLSDYIEEANKEFNPTEL